jgi:hypothetical protein
MIDGSAIRTEIAFVAGDTGWVIAGDTAVVDAMLSTLVLRD